MKNYELYNRVKNVKYEKLGDDVDVCIETNRDEKIIYVLFSETNSKRDWENNFNFPIKLYKKQESC